MARSLRRGSIFMEFAVSGVLVLASFFIIWQLLFRQTLENQSIFRKLKQERLEMLESPSSSY
jgi:hypothetical protein